MAIDPVDNVGAVDAATFSLFDNASLSVSAARNANRASDSSIVDTGLTPQNSFSAAPNVVGMSRINAINAIIAAGYDYSIYYEGNNAGATSQNNDTVHTQATNGSVIAIYVWQYVQTVEPSILFSFNMNQYPGIPFQFTADPVNFAFNVNSTDSTIHDLFSSIVPSFSTDGGAPGWGGKKIKFNAASSQTADLSSLVNKEFIILTSNSDVYPAIQPWKPNTDYMTTININTNGLANISSVINAGSSVSLQTCQFDVY